MLGLGLGPTGLGLEPSGLKLGPTGLGLGLSGLDYIPAKNQKKTYIDNFSSCFVNLQHYSNYLACHTGSSVRLV